VTFADPIAWEATLGVRPSSPAWKATLRGLYGTPLTEQEAELFRAIAQREAPAGGADEFLAVVGRRGGKSESIARVATFEAAHGGHEVALAPGQLGLVAVISPRREQSQEILNYCRGLAALPQVRPLLDGDPTQFEIRFKTGVAIRVMTADAVAVSSPTVVCAIRDEQAKFPGDDTTTPDREIDASLRPALAPLAGAPRRRLIGITSAYIREGVAFETDRDHFGRPDADVLVVRGSTEQFNPSIDRAWLARERRRVGERVFAREYLAEWQDATTDGWFGSCIDQCVDKGREFSEPMSGVRYVAGIDAAFRGDQFALVIAHREFREGKPALTVVDLAMSWQPKSGEMLNARSTVAEVAEEINEYGAIAFADQFSFDPLKEMFAQRKVHLREMPWTGANKPAMFTRVRAAMTDGLVRLPDDRALIREFHAIRGRLLRSGGERLEAAAGHDDIAHAAVMSICVAMDRNPDYGESEQERRDRLKVYGLPSHLVRWPVGVNEW
jgi:hypothetical protein